MEFGANFFDAAPETWADVPVAALRALARQQRPEARTYQSESASPRVPQNRASSPPIQETPPPEMPRMEMPALKQQPSEWGSLAKQVATAVAPKKDAPDPLTARMSELERMIAAARGTWKDSAPTGPYFPIGDGRGPRAYSPTEAPDTGEVDTRDVPEGYFGKNRAFESGNNPRATNPITGAGGDYQFLPSTWRGLMKEAPHLGLTEDGLYDSKQQDAAMRYYTGKSVSILRPMLGRAPTGGELYAAHLLGHSGGPRVIAALDRPLTETIDPRAIAANPWLKNYATGQDLITDLNRKFGG